jgi:hypothetical protein
VSARVLDCGPMTLPLRTRDLARAVRIVGRCSGTVGCSAPLRWLRCRPADRIPDWRAQRLSAESHLRVHRWQMAGNAPTALSRRSARRPRRPVRSDSEWDESLNAADSLVLCGVMSVLTRRALNLCSSSQVASVTNQALFDEDLLYRKSAGWGLDMPRHWNSTWRRTLRVQQTRAFKFGG